MQRRLKKIHTPVAMPGQWSFPYPVYHGGRSNIGMISTMKRDCGEISREKRCTCSTRYSVEGEKTTEIQG
jgi:hypothetical protein